MPSAAIARSRAPTPFSARIKAIRAQNAVMDKNKDRWRVSSKITDCVRTASRPYAIGDPRGRVAVRASSSVTARMVKTLTAGFAPFELLLHGGMDRVAQNFARNELQVAAQVVKQSFDQRCKAFFQALFDQGFDLGLQPGEQRCADARRKRFDLLL